MGAKLLKQPDAIAGGDLADWGPVAQPAGDVVSHTSGLTYTLPDNARKT